MKFKVKVHSPWKGVAEFTVVPIIEGATVERRTVEEAARNAAYAWVDLDDAILASYGLELDRSPEALVKCTATVEGGDPC